MKVRIEIASHYLEDEHCLYVDGELGQVLADLKSGKIDISNHIGTDSWLLKGDKTLLPTEFTVSLKEGRCQDHEWDALIIVYDFYLE